jgi:peptidoglycan biosynthesis protein MviN/MurJ (putative lipid II flippase)
MLREALRPERGPDARRGLATAAGVAALVTSGLLIVADHRERPGHWVDRYMAAPLFVCVPATTAMLSVLWQHDPPVTWWERHAVAACAWLYALTFCACAAALLAPADRHPVRTYVKKEKGRHAPRRT